MTFYIVMYKSAISNEWYPYSPIFLNFDNAERFYNSRATGASENLKIIEINDFRTVKSRFEEIVVEQPNEKRILIL